MHISFCYGKPLHFICTVNIFHWHIHFLLLFHRMILCILCLPLLKSFHSQNKNDKARVLHTHRQRRFCSNHECDIVFVCICCHWICNRIQSLLFTPSSRICSRYWALLLLSLSSSLRQSLPPPLFLFFLLIQLTIHLASIASQQVHCISLNWNWWAQWKCTTCHSIHIENYILKLIVLSIIDRYKWMHALCLTAAQCARLYHYICERNYSIF